MEKNRHLSTSSKLQRIWQHRSAPLLLVRIINLRRDLHKVPTHSMKIPVKVWTRIFKYSILIQSRMWQVRSKVRDISRINSVIQMSKIQLHFDCHSSMIRKKRIQKVISCYKKSTHLKKSKKALTRMSQTHKRVLSYKTPYFKILWVTQNSRAPLLDRMLHKH